MEINLERFVHLSIDDICGSLRWLAHNQPDSIFDMRLFGKLRQWHMQYGAKFSLYCFAMADDFLVSEIPMRYANEFRDSASWMRFGYHGKSALRFSTDSGYAAGYELFHYTASRLEMQTTSIFRLHNWIATEEQKCFLGGKGVETLLYPDDDSYPYETDDSFEDNGMQHWRTRIRFEYLSEINESALHIGLKRIVGFTHERFFDSEIEKMEKAIRMFHENQYIFI